MLFLVLAGLPAGVAGEEESEGAGADGEVILEGVEAIRVAIGLAREAMQEEDFERSREILQRVIATPEFELVEPADRVAALFFLGQSHAALDEHREAVRAYRTILASYPGLVRVRLELARSLYLLHEDQAADQHFRLALTGDLPEAVEANIRHYLRQIRQRRRWSFDFRASVLRNTNVNVAPNIRQIELFGLPFELDDDAQAKSGLGISTQAVGEYRFPLTDNSRLRVGAFAEHTHYTNSRFNDSIFAGHLGPQYFFDAGIMGESSMSVLAQGYRRWFGNEKFNRGLGPAVEFTFEPTDRLRLGTRVEHFYVRYDERDDMDGTYTSMTARPAYAISPVSFGVLTLGVAYDRTDAERLRNWQYRIGLGYHRDFPLGFTWNIEPEYRLLDYEEEWPAFGERRRDHVWNIRTGLLNRRLELLGFTPVLSYRYQYRSSTIDLYDFDQHRVELSVTRNF